MKSCDVVFVGSSPNALAGASRLARAGQKVVVLEERSFLGGPIVTAEFAPGFRADIALPNVSADLEMAADLGLSLQATPPRTVTLLGPSPVTLGRPALPRAAEDAIALLRTMSRMAAPALPDSDAKGTAALAALGEQLLGLGERRMHEVLKLLCLPVRDFVAQSGLSEAEGRVVCASAFRSGAMGPFAPGSTYPFLFHEAMGDGLFGPSLLGGVGSLTSALASKAESLGVEIRKGVGPVAAEVADGTAQGVIFGDERLLAGAVISDLDLVATCSRLVRPYELPPEVNRRIRSVRCSGSVARVHLGLRALPSFLGVSGDALNGTLVLAPDVVFLEKAWDQIKRGKLPERPYLEVTIPSASDPSFAKEGHHVLSIWVHGAPYGSGNKEAVLSAAMREISAFAPSIRELIVASDVLLPEDLEARFGLTRGHLYGGAIELGQAFFLRAVPGCTGFETPIDRLFLASSSVHPGGYSGLCGWAAAGQKIRLTEAENT